MNKSYLSILAVILGVSLLSINAYRIAVKPSFNVGDCIRPLGYSNVKTVTVVRSSVIEAQDNDGYYYTYSPEEILKVPCNQKGPADE